MSCLGDRSMQCINSLQCSKHTIVTDVDTRKRPFHLSILESGSESAKWDLPLLKYYHVALTPIALCMFYCSQNSSREENGR